MIYIFTDYKTQNIILAKIIKKWIIQFKFQTMYTTV